MYIHLTNFEHSRGIIFSMDILFAKTTSSDDKLKPTSDEEDIMSICYTTKTSVAD